jgi:aldehyde dehydrogenase (NAD+)
MGSMKVVTQHYINGAFVDSRGQELMEILSPATGEPIGRATLGSAEDARLAIAAAKTAFETYSVSSLAERGEILTRLANAITPRIDDMIAIMMEEYGGLTTFCRFVVEQARDFFARAPQLLVDKNFQEQMGDATIRRVPCGVAGLITPWNGSCWFVCMKAASALAAGCTVVVKPSEMSALQTQVLLECFHEAKIPAGLLNVVNGRGDVVGAEIVRSPDVQKISFTGSTAVGKKIARDSVETLKRVTLELGGKSPFIVLKDANLDRAIPFALQAGFMNSGQACVAGTRLLVPNSRLSEFTEALKAAVQKTKVGEPQDSEARIGPLVSRKQYERVESYIQRGLEEGAEVLIGGLGHPSGLDKGNFVKPTVFTNVSNDMTIAREEIFGPVLSVIGYDSEEEAVRIANETTYGLQAYISTEDIAHGREVGKKILAGRVLVNRFCDQPNAPFGGFKQSGIGREFGRYGLQSYQELQVIFG